jgi:2-C-methyl-D-erythritol 2,4-cyclodiphosphate synthase
VRVGFGYDSHRLAPGGRLVLGGVEIPFDSGLVSHSDGDVLLHALIDAVLGALGLGDIGSHFPDTDPQYKGVSSLGLLVRVLGLARDRGFEVSWADTTVVAESPKIAPHIGRMREAITSAGVKAVNIKAKTDEGMGFVGRGEGIAAYAVCLCVRAGDTQPPPEG